MERSDSCDDCDVVKIYYYDGKKCSENFLCTMIIEYSIFYERLYNINDIQNFKDRCYGFHALKLLKKRSILINDIIEYISLFI